MAVKISIFHGSSLSPFEIGFGFVLISHNLHAADVSDSSVSSNEGVSSKIGLYYSAYLR